MQSEELLAKLVSYPTISSDSNLELINFIATYLKNLGIDSQLVHNEEKSKANLYAVVGPQNKPGIMLSGHTDVVPVSGQSWSADPFVLRKDHEKLYARGSADMKGFIACVLSVLGKLNPQELVTPIHLAFSYDEEVGCIGVRRLLDMLQGASVKPKYCIVGEPTLMQPVIAHKGKTAVRVSLTGSECHSSLAPQGLNAIYLASDMINAIRALQQSLINDGHHDHDYDISHTTLHVGVIDGGTALNIVPNRCEFIFEIRNLPEDSPEALIVELREKAKLIVASHSNQFPEASIELDIYNTYPALSTPTDSDIVQLVKELTGANRTGKIAFGTEGGLFTEQLQIQTIVMGPGSIEQAHKPDEFITQSELRKCDEFLLKLVQALSE